MSNSPEVFRGGAETAVETQVAAGERMAELAKNSEKGVENSPDKQAERVAEARNETNEALMSKEQGGAEKRAGGEPTASAIRTVTKKDKTKEYKKTMKAIQSQMSTPSRTFSKVIHSPVVEKTSEVVGSTVARPNAIVAGSATALVLVTAVYAVAKTYGYPLSGFETIAAFVFGWLIGLIFDYFRVTLRGGSQRRS